MIPITCGNCNKHEERDYVEHFRAPEGWLAIVGASAPGSGDIFVCSLDCLIEIGWTLREAQPKLSKSRQP